ncbi:MAG: hypothetical protein ACHQNE_10660, partial [Candidatus Kapaibacterium sp.]
AAHPATIHKANLPKAGTIIIDTYYVTDSSGELVPKSTVDPNVPDDTLRVIRSNFRIFGRSRCVETASATTAAARSKNDTTLISYADNGDLYMRVLGRDTAWARLPFGLAPGEIIRKKLPNDSGTMFLKEFDMPHTQTFEVLGTDTASGGGKIYHCIRLQIVDIRKYQGTDWLQGTLYWYSPEIGYFVRMNFGWDGPYFLNQQIKEYIVPSNE